MRRTCFKQLWICRWNLLETTWVQKRRNDIVIFPLYCQNTTSLLQFYCVDVAQAGFISEFWKQEWKVGWSSEFRGNLQIRKVCTNLENHSTPTTRVTVLKLLTLLLIKHAHVAAVTCIKKVCFEKFYGEHKVPKIGINHFFFHTNTKIEVIVFISC